MAKEPSLRTDVSAVLTVIAWCAIIILPFWLGAIALAVVIGWTIALLWAMVLLWAYLWDRFGKRIWQPRITQK
jgi:hypothetical protein